MIEFRWANDAGAHGMPTPEQCEAEGYRRVRQHPFWPASWLMAKGEMLAETEA